MEFKGAVVELSETAAQLTGVQHCIPTFSKRPQDISSCVCGKQRRYFKSKCDLFLTLTICLLYHKPNQSISAALSQHKIQN